MTGGINTGGMTTTMMTWYSKLFLERSKKSIKFDLWAQVRGIPENNGINLPLFTAM